LFTADRSGRKAGGLYVFVKDELIVNTASVHPASSTAIIISAYRYIAITNLPIIPVFVEYLGQFLIDFNQIYRHSSVPKNTSP